MAIADPAASSRDWLAALVGTDVLRAWTALLDAFPLAVVALDRRDRVLFWNRAAERLFGWRASEVVGMSLPTIPDDLREQAEEFRRAAMVGETVMAMETRRRRRDGTTFDAAVSITPVRGVDGTVHGTLRILADVTAERAARRELASADEVRARLAAIVESSDDAIASKSLDGVIASWNPAAERLFGWTAAEAVGRHITLIIPKDRYAEEDDVLARLRRGERIDHFETVRVTKDGRQINVSITVSPVRDGSGRIVGASKIARDVTAQKRLEEERTRLLEQEQAARPAAEALNRTKDEFIATLSHELRTPLNAIFGWARMLQTADGDAILPRAADAIVRSATAQSRLIEDLLELSRIATGRVRLEFAPVDLARVVDAALEAVRPAAAAKGVALVAALDPSVGTVQGAADRLQQIVWNLVTNAVKFTPRGGRIDVAVRRRDGHAEISVADNGEGIAPDLLPHVFEQFRQGDSSTTRAHGGLGLGLALVKRLVEMHGGQVQAVSAGRGRGATLTVTLPLPPAE